MSSFKKQAIKLKQEFQEKGLSVPLVSVQEALARSYGFNNRHVALSKEKEINQVFATLHQSNKQTEEVSYPEFITAENYHLHPYLFSDEMDDDPYINRFDDLEIFSGAELKDGHRITMFKEEKGKIALSDIIKLDAQDLENIFEDWEWAPKISDFIARLTLTSFLEQGDIFDDKAPEDLKVQVEEGFLKDEEKLKKAWKQVMKCFDFSKRIEGVEIPVYKTTNISYKYEKAKDRFVLVKEKTNPKRSKALLAIEGLNLPDEEGLLSPDLAKRVGSLDKKDS